MRSPISSQDSIWTPLGRDMAYCCPDYEIHNSKTDANRKVVIAIIQASKEGDDDTLRYIFSRNDVNVNSLDCSSITPLFTAMSFNNPSTVRIFLLLSSKPEDSYISVLKLEYYTG